MDSEIGFALTENERREREIDELSWNPDRSRPGCPLAVAAGRYRPLREANKADYRERNAFLAFLRSFERSRRPWFGREEVKRKSVRSRERTRTVRHARNRRAMVLLDGQLVAMCGAREDKPSFWSRARPVDSVSAEPLKRAGANYNSGSGAGLGPRFAGKEIGAIAKRAAQTIALVGEMERGFIEFNLKAIGVE